jgi:hypothetical protein
VAKIILIFLSIVLFFPTFILFARWYVNKMVYLIIGKKHDAIDWILKTGDVPPMWLKSELRKNKKNKPAVMEPWEITIKGKYVRNLKTLISYMKTCSLVANEAERNSVIEQLEGIGCEWEKRRLACE